MRILTLVLTLLAAPLSAHEFWIEPDAYQVQASETITGQVVNGQDFAGNKLAYLPQRFVHFVALAGGKVVNVPGRVGDQPALSMPPVDDGLHVLAYQSRPSTVDYENWEKFQRFVDHKDLGDVKTRHLARNLPEDGFKEIYSRYSKSLVGVGTGAGADRRTGLETEIVALTNPYTDDLSGGMRLQLFYRANVRADEQIEIYEKSPDGSVTIFLVRTDADGIATVPVKSGYSYMADAVVLREPAAALASASNAVWETLWANMTWGVPN